MSSSAPTRATLEELAAAGGVYRLLARIWLQEVDGALLEQLAAPPLAEAFTAAGGVVPPDEPATLEELAVDYCQLFVGPMNHLPPYQSVWQSGRFESSATDSVRQFAEISGYNLDGLPRHLMPDHLGVELDLMGHLLGHPEAAGNAEAEQVDAAIELAGLFFERHLSWPAKLLAMAEKRAGTEFYRASIALTREFLAAHWPI